MRPSEALALNRAAIGQVVESHHASNARVFGSVLHGQDTDSSDLDILIDPKPETTLMDVAAIRVELQRLLGRFGRCRDAQGAARQVPQLGARRGDAGMTKALRVSDYLGHILQTIERIGRYTADMDEAG